MLGHVAKKMDLSSTQKVACYLGNVRTSYALLVKSIGLYA